jgi:endonuclease/exonuclease/phosphatase family metal-dependent hydrolase
MTANTTSGNNQSYDAGDGVRLFEGLKPDIVLIQEFNVGDNSSGAIRSFVDTTFGPSFAFFRETGSLPNGIISRYPIVESGSWTDPRVDNRGFAWAKIGVPGPHAMWAVSLHLLTTSAANRAAEATALASQITAVVPAADYLIVGGDLNTGTRAEACVTTLAALVSTTAPYADDGHGNSNTSGTRNKPHDWLMPDADLAALEVATEVAGQSFPAGLVFDSRVFAPLASVPPITPSDSGAANMQHMPVLKDFVIPVP